ncbi:hypothetical protein [Amycolatopsis plumensis]|uniref:Uncharacterized protein n=1 Tax=Amycolatopsis plumensis TaxID=236508 RepID=A0ABV5UC59_9PSEU
MSDTALVAAGGVVLALLGRDTVPLAAGIFAVMLQLTLVGEGWPLRGRGPHWPDVAALASCWVVGWGLCLGLVATGAVPEDYAAWFAVLGAPTVAGSAIASMLVVATVFEVRPAVQVTLLEPLVARGAAVPERLAGAWTTHATLNALSLAVILHVAVWRRRPVSAP